MQYQLSTVKTGAIVITGNLNEIQSVLEDVITGQRTDIELPVLMQEFAECVTDQLTSDGVQVLNVSTNNDRQIVTVHCAYKFSFILVQVSLAARNQVMCTRYYVGKNYAFARQHGGGVGAADIMDLKDFEASSLSSLIAGLGQEIKNKIDTLEPNVRWRKALHELSKLHKANARYNFQDFTF